MAITCSFCLFLYDGFMFLQLLTQSPVKMMPKIIYMYIESVAGSRPLGMGDLSFIFDQFRSMGYLQLCPECELYQTSSVFYFIIF